MQFPKMTRKELEQYDAFITSQEFYNKRKKALNREWVREKTNMKELAEEQILRQIEEKIAETAKELERLKTVTFFLRNTAAYSLHENVHLRIKSSQDCIK